MEESLEDRLKSHAQAFDGLLSLIPAKYYYDEEDKSEPWQRKKQTKEQAKAARRAKLDPDNARTARDLLDEREKEQMLAGKRKRAEESQEEEDDDDAAFVLDGLVREKPMEGVKRKKVKTVAKEASTAADTVKVDESLSKTKTKQSNEGGKPTLKQAKKEARKEKLNKRLDQKLSDSLPTARAVSQHEERQSLEDEASSSDHEVSNFDGQNLAEMSPSSSSSSKPPSPTFDLPNTTSGTSSIASISTIQKTPLAKITKKSLSTEPSADQEELRARLHARIAELRQARRADGSDGKPARSRTELIEQRRRKLEQRKAAKKALREQAKAEERRQRDEALARGSPLITPGTMSPLQPASPMADTKNNFSFSRMQFDNGQVMSADLSSVHGQGKKSALNTISKTTLETLEKQQERLSEMTPEQRAAAKEKDAWIRANKRAQGQRVKDDTSLLKKALKRKEGKKKKSTKEWDERITGVANAQAARQKQREDNIAKRREDKLNRGKTGGKKSGSKNKKKKPKARPGFEGSFKAGSARKK